MPEAEAPPSGAALSMRPLVVGLTGGIASGKTAASDHFAALGADVIDTDVLARDVVAPGTEGLSRVLERFGDGLLDEDGALDRRQLRRIVFADDQARRDLEGLLHPMIRAALWHRIAVSPGPYVVAVVPLLIEGGLDRHVDRVLVIDVDTALQRRRLAERDGSSEEMIDRLLAAQCSREERLARADDVIDNSGSLEALHQQVLDLHRRYLALKPEPQPAP